MHEMLTYWQAWCARRSLSATKTWVIISPGLTLFSFHTLISMLSLQFILVEAVTKLFVVILNKM